METTRHFTATAYVVNDGATVLHEHPSLDLWLPPGGHLDRDELPHRAAVREAREEIGLDVTLVHDSDGVVSPTARPIPQPASVMLEDIDVIDGTVAHQHVDFIYYASAASRAIAPGDEEVHADGWRWFDADAVRTDDRLAADVRSHALAAIQSVSGATP